MNNLKPRRLIASFLATVVLLAAAPASAQAQTDDRWAVVARDGDRAMAELIASNLVLRTRCVVTPDRVNQIPAGHDVIVLGGSAAVPDAAVAGLNVADRLQGADRIETARAVLDWIDSRPALPTDITPRCGQPPAWTVAAPDCDGETEAVVARTGDRAMAELVASWAVLDTGCIVPPDRTSLVGRRSVVVLGGTAAVPNAALNGLIIDTRLQGADRIATAHAVLDWIDSRTGGADEPDLDAAIAAHLATKLYKFDHDAIAGLFPQCRKIEQPAWVADWLAEWRAVFAGWDSAAVLLDDASGGERAVIASGWWNDEQLGQYADGLTERAVRADARWFSVNTITGRDTGILELWPPQRSHVRNMAMPSPSNLSELYAAATHVGWDPTAAGGSFEPLLQYVTPYGIPQAGGEHVAWPDSINRGKLLADWTDWRLQFPPTTGENPAWAMNTFLGRTTACTVPAMEAVCAASAASGQPPANPLLRESDPFGRILWSIVCPQY